MAVKLELYRVFQEVARMGNISAAAQNLYISQSAVSQSIKQLEEQLQVRLFSRSTRGVVLTSEGKMLLDDAKMLVAGGCFAVCEGANMPSSYPFLF